MFLCVWCVDVIGLCRCLLSMFFFFKQKTAYEMRISDWSSDVCSSDLPRSDAVGAGFSPGCSQRPIASRTVGQNIVFQMSCQCAASGWIVDCRSEEHTSELQSLMRISYAVFCLKKKTT